MAVPEEPAVVSYTVREMFERVNDQLVRMETKLDVKADHSDVVELRARVDALESAKDRAWGLLVGISLASGLGGGAVAAALSRALGG